MGAGHDHGPITAGAANSRKLALVLGMMLVVAAVQIIGSAFSGSLALLADAGHTVTDSFGVALALAAMWIAARPATSKRTFGFQRAEILAAAVNAIVLFALCAFIVLEAVDRLREPAEVSGLGMVVVAAFGLVMNIAALFILRSGARESLNVKGAYLEPPEVAIEDRRGVDRAFAALTATLLAHGHTLHLATHDPRLLEGALALVERRGIPRSRIDLQFLHGVRRDLQTRYAERGLPVTVYVPYGTEWYPYLTRRLAERPANMWFFLSNLLRVRR